MKKKKTTVDTMQTPYASLPMRMRARVCVFVLTVAVFPSDIEKMGCVRNCATYLSFDLTCVLDGHLDDDDATGLCFE